MDFATAIAGHSFFMTQYVLPLCTHTCPSFGEPVIHTQLYRRVGAHTAGYFCIHVVGNWKYFHRVKLWHFST